MDDQDRTKEELTEEIERLRLRMSGLEHAKEDLQNSESRFQALFENMGNAVAVYRAEQDGNDFVFMDLNRAAEKNEQINRSDVLGKSVLRVFPRLKEFGLFDVFQRVWRTGQAEHYPVKEYKDNRIQGWRDNFVYRLPSGEIVAVYSDETERKKAEQVLRESEERFRAIFENEHAVMLIINPDAGRIEDCSPGACAFYGYSKDELTKKKMTEINTLAPEGLFELLQKAKRNQQRYFDFRHRLANGEVRDVEVCTGPVRFAGKVLLCSIINDVTDRKRAEEALRGSEELYRAVFDNAGIGISLRDRDGRFVQVNSAMMGMLGYSDIDFHHLTPSDITHFDDRDISKWIFESIMRGEISTYRLEKRYIRKDGSTIWGDVSVSAIRNENGDHIATVGVIADITDRKLADTKLRASLREKEILLREIHHRVKNNLQLITSLLRLQLRQMKGEDESLVEIFEDIQSRIKAMALVHESLYRSEELDLIDISQYMQRILGSIRASSPRSMREVSIKADVKNISLRIDAAIACGLIVNELVTNSLKHAFPQGREGEIVVTLSPIGEEEFQLTVRDNGIGMPEHVDLQQPESLGLDLVVNLAKQLHGSVEFTGGEGTEVRVRFREPANSSVSHKH